MTTSIFLRILADRLDAFVADGFLRTDVAEPLRENVEAFLRRYDDPDAPLSRVQLALIVGAIDNALAEVTR